MSIKIQVFDNILQMNDSYAAENRRIFEEHNARVPSRRRRCGRSTPS